jgi:hypothetical protein
MQELVVRPWQLHYVVGKSIAPESQGRRFDSCRRTHICIFRNCFCLRLRLYIFFYCNLNLQTRSTVSSTEKDAQISRYLSQMLQLSWEFFTCPRIRTSIQFNGILYEYTYLNQRQNRNVRVKWNRVRTPSEKNSKYFKAYIRSYVFIAWFPDLSVAIRICSLNVINFFIFLTERTL